MSETKLVDIITGTQFAVRLVWEIVKALGKLRQEFQQIPEEEREAYLAQWREAAKQDAESRRNLWEGLIDWINAPQ